MQEVLQREYLNNTILDYIIAASIIFFGLLIVRLFKRTIILALKRWSEGTSTRNDNFFVNGLDRFGIPALYYFIVYAGLNSLTLSVKTRTFIQDVTTVVITFFILRLLSSVILLLLQNHIRSQEKGEEKIRQLGGLMIIINIAIWIVGIVFLLDNMGKDVTAIITGLGIGGIAVALAAQNILGDLFNYFVIFFDRPFEVGDFIIVDDKMGSVEYIGIKTTRIRSLSGEQLILGNSNLTSSRIHNFKRMERRRILFYIDVEYNTALEKLKIIPGLLKEIVLQQNQITFDRAHFAGFKDWSLRFEVVYFVLSGDYNLFMDIQQEINFKIFEIFNQHDISFAFPTQTMFLNPTKRLEKDLEDILKDRSPSPGPEREHQLK